MTHYELNRSKGFVFDRDFSNGIKLGNIVAISGEAQTLWRKQRQKSQLGLENSVQCFSLYLQQPGEEG